MIAKCVRKCSQIHKVHSLFVRTKRTCPDWTIYSWQGFNSLGCPLMLRTNYRCVQSLNISVDVAKCVEKCSQIHPVHSLFVSNKKWLVLTEQSIHGKVSTQLGCPLMLRTNYRCVQSLNISVDVAKCVENVQTFTQNTHFFSVTKKRLVLTEQSIHGKVSTH